MKFALRVVYSMLILVVGWTLVPCGSFAQTAEPTEHHRVLHKDVGTWQADIKVYIEGPDSEPLESSGVETNHMLGGFWLISKMDYEMFGQKMSGHGQFGYDPSKKKYIGTWCDSGSPYMTVLEGDWNEETQSWVYQTRGRDPNGAPSIGKIVTTIKDENHKTFTMYMGTPGQEEELAKIMEVEYTRKE